MPELLGAEGAEIRYAINGLLSLTCDGCPILGESQVKGLWTAAAVWIKEGPGVGRAVAEWMTQGYSEIDVSHSDIARFHPHQMRREHTRLRTTEAFIKTYGIVHPAEQYESDRNQRLAPMHESQQKLGAVFFETAGWERPHWYESNAGLLDAVRRRGDAARARVGLALVEPDHQRRAPAHARGRRRHRPDARSRSSTSRAPGALRTTRPADLRGAVRRGRRRVIYTPVLDAKGGFRSDLTVMRLGDDHFRVVTGGAHGPADRKWFADHLAGDGTTLTDRTDEVSTIGLWGPRARDILAGADRRRRLRRAASAFLTCREIEVGRRRPCWPRGSPTSVSSAGSSTSRPTSAARCGRPARDRQPATARCRSASASTARPAGSRRATARTAYELDGERRIVEAGMQRPKVKAADFVGREAYLAQREDAARRTVLCTLTVEDHTSASGVKRYMLGGEPILTRDGGALTDGHGHHPYVTSAGSAPSLGKHVLLAYLPPEQAVGRQRARGVRTWRSSTRSTVGSVDATPLFDPDQRADPLMRSDVLVCVKRVPDSHGAGRADRGRAVGRRALRRLHDEPRTRSAPSSWPSQAAKSSGGSATVLTLGDADADGAAAHRAGASGATRRRTSWPTSSLRGPADVAREIAAVVQDHEASGRVVRPGAARQRRRRQRGLPGRHPARLRARAAGRQRRQHRRGQGRPGRRGRRRTRRTRRPTTCRCRPSSPSWRAASSRATRRSRAG